MFRANDFCTMQSNSNTDADTYKCTGNIPLVRYNALLVSFHFSKNYFQDKKILQAN